jgi:hypothetical protein
MAPYLIALPIASIIKQQTHDNTSFQDLLNLTVWASEVYGSTGGIRYEVICC